MRIDAVPFQSGEHDGPWVGDLESEQLFFSDAAADFQSLQRLRSIAENGSGCLLDGHLGELLKVMGASAKKRRESMSWSTTEGRETVWLGKSHHLRVLPPP